MDMDYALAARRFCEGIAQLGHTRSQRRMSGFSRGESHMLSYLTDNGGSATPGELSAELGVSTARIAALLKSTEGKGWVQRALRDDDKRCSTVTLTESGAQFICDRRQEIRSHTELMLRRLGDEDSAECIRIMYRIIDIERELSKDNEC